MKTIKFLARLKCAKCGNDKFTLTKKMEGNDKRAIMIREVLCHDGFGWDISTFDIECTKCKSKEDNIIEVTP